MISCQYAVTMAAYNEWMNARLYTAAGGLSPGELVSERKAFFGSIIGTLNHIVVGDTIWLKRFATHPAGHASLDPVRELPDPVALNQIQFARLDELFARRTLLDTTIRQWANELSETDLQHVLDYENMKGIPARKSFAGLILQFFNHQTHHRGQVTTLLFQTGEDVGITDVHALLPDEGRLLSDDADE